MKVGDLVSHKYTKPALFGIVAGQYKGGTGLLWLIQWNNEKRSYERKEHLEVIHG
jgi:hypothetical protein